MKNTSLLKVKQQYELERSPFYRLSNKRKLASLLGVDHSLISSLEKSDLTSQYNFFRDRESRRFITEPTGQLALIHKSLLKYLSRISPSEYLHSAIKKRSYKTNATRHVLAKNVVKIDIKKFFQSVKFGYIYDFFSNSLCCSKDIATILAKLCTVQTNKHGVHLPTGSCISPLLSFLANQKLFNSIKRVCDQQNCQFTVYVDDITISGKDANKPFLNLVAKIIAQHGYDYHKIKVYENEPATITGLIVSKGRLHLPHERAKKIRELQKALSVSKDKPMRRKLLASLVGRLSEAEQINQYYKLVRKKLLLNLVDEWSEIVTYRANKSRRHSARTT